MTEKPKKPGIWTGQGGHFAALGILLLIVWRSWIFLGEPHRVLFWVAVATPVLHQVYTWMTWRLELQSGAIGRVLGFQVYLAGFFLLFVARFVTLGLLAWKDRGSLGVSPVLQSFVLLPLLAGGLYAFYSVARYFGFRRAAGADHFDPRYRDMPLVKQGIFRFTSNGMYVYAFFIFWAIAVAGSSNAALLVAAFSHAYIWVHFFATEKPDMDFLYG